jgi:hypothetical protein
MAVFMLALVVIAALLAIASGVWVAIALMRAVSTDRAGPTAGDKAESTSGN